MNHITIIPTFQRKKSIPKQLKDLQLLPLNEQFSKLTMSIVGDDDLRPVMQGNFFDVENKKIVSTDAHKLSAINMPQETILYLKQNYSEELKTEQKGLIFHTIKELQDDYSYLKKRNNIGISFEEFIKEREIIDGRYPNYDAVTPKQFIAEINVDYQKLYWYAKVLLDAKVIDDKNLINSSNEYVYQNKKIEYLKDSYVPFLAGDKQIILTYFLDGQTQYIGFNAQYICDILKLAMELNGKYFGKFGISSKSGAMVVELEDGLDSRKDSIGLIMPVILVNNPDYTIGQREFDKNVSLYYDLDTNTIVSDEQGYLIDESIGFVPVKGVLTAPRLKVEPQVSKAENNSSNLIESRIKGLTIALKVAKAENKPSIEKRIKGLEIAKKMRKEDKGIEIGENIKNITNVIYEDDGNTLKYGTKNNLTLISVNNLSQEEIKMELNFEKDMLNRQKNDLPNKINQNNYVKNSLTSTLKEKDDSRKMLNSAIKNIEILEKIVIPFYESKVTN